MTKRPTPLKIKHLKNGKVTVTARGKVVCKTSSREGAEAFIAGWREQEATIAARDARCLAAYLEMRREHEAAGK